MYPAFSQRNESMLALGGSDKIFCCSSFWTSGSRCIAAYDDVGVSKKSELRYIDDLHNEESFGANKPSPYLSSPFLPDLAFLQ